MRIIGIECREIIAFRQHLKCARLGILDEFACLNIFIIGQSPCTFAFRRLEESHLRGTDARGHDSRLFITMQILHAHQRRGHPRHAARLADHFRQEQMQNLIRRHANMPACVVTGLIEIIACPIEQVIGKRATELVHFHTHAHAVAVRPHFVVANIQQFRIEQMQLIAERSARNAAHQAFAIHGHGGDNQPRHLRQGHASGDIAIARPFAPVVFNGLLGQTIRRAIIVGRTRLQDDAVRADNVRFAHGHESPCIVIIAIGLAGSGAQRLQALPDMPVRRCRHGSPSRIQP